MGNIVIRHSKNWNLGDGSVTALHSPGSLINSGQISVPVQLKKEKIVKLLNLALAFVIWRVFFPNLLKFCQKKGKKLWYYKILALNFVIWRVFQCKILTKKGENSWNYWICYIAIICTLWLTTFFQIWQNPSKEKGKIREITESATYYTLWFDEFFQMNKKFLHITGETTPAGNLFAGSADLTQGLSVWTHIS